MYYLNQLINSIYNIFSSDKYTLIGDNDNDNDNDMVVNPQDHKTKNYTTLQANISNTKICEGQHPYGYSPFYKNGHCRFCWGLNPNKNLKN